VTGWRRSLQSGLSLLELLAVLGLIGLVAAGASPALRRIFARASCELTARSLTSDIRLCRSEAIGKAVARALVFDRRADGTYVVTLIRDGDGDGVHADDIRRGIDTPLEGPTAFRERYGQARLGFHPSLHQLRSPPPVGSQLAPLVDPIRLGTTDTVSFSTRGTMTSGTFYLTDGVDRQWAVVVYGTTGRLRVWEYVLKRGQWVERF
jgi:prepilin-type N-terminal cleavage/methylation domain-containing protein